MNEEENHEQDAHAALGAVFDEITDHINIYVQPDGDLAVSIHNIDVLNQLMVTAVEQGLNSEDPEFNEDTAYGATWVMGIYQAFHDAVEMKAAMHSVPNDISELFDEDGK